MRFESLDEFVKNFENEFEIIEREDLFVSAFESNDDAPSEFQTLEDIELKCVTQNLPDTTYKTNLTVSVVGTEPLQSNACISLLIGPEEILFTRTPNVCSKLQWTIYELEQKLRVTPLNLANMQCFCVAPENIPLVREYMEKMAQHVNWSTHVQLNVTVKKFIKGF